MREIKGDICRMNRVRHSAGKRRHSMNSIIKNLMDPAISKMKMLKNKTYFFLSRNG